MSKKGQTPAEPDREPRRQAAAAPWRRTEAGELQVLLVTSRETRRWVLPKGWPIKGLNSAQTAAREALEEAGVEGEPSKKKIGVYHYDKRLRSGRVQRVAVSVFALKVTVELETWREAAEREKLWTSPAEAADLVHEPDLAEILRRFAPD